VRAILKDRLRKRRSKVE